MDVLNWRGKGWSGRKFELYAAEQPIGNLAFEGWSGYDAVYTSGNTVISFKSKGWFDQDITIMYNGEKIGTASVASLTGKAQLYLLTGELYTMESNLLSNNRSLLSPTGETVISFKQSAFSFSKGTIEVSDALTGLTKEVLVSTSLYLKAIAEQQIAVMIAVFIPLLTNGILFWD